MTDSFNDLVNRRPNQNIGHFSQKTGFDYLLQREEDEREKQIKQMKLGSYYKERLKLIYLIQIKTNEFLENFFRKSADFAIA